MLDRINPAVEIRISATPKTLRPDETVKVYRQDVIAAEMIKKEVVLNPDIELDFSEERTLNQNLIKAALGKRNQQAEVYKELGININPLLLIQLPNDTKETMTADDTAIAEQVKTYLRVACDITEENGLLAVWLANEKSNLPNLERPDNLAQVLLFKEAIALGWDCPRAAVLLIFRKLQSDQFTIQTVGRILRMPEQKHYPKDMLNIGYVYTDIAKDKIQIVTADSDYILNNTLIAYRREGLENLSLPAYYSERPNVERNYLGPDFRRTLYEVAGEFWKLERGAGLFSIEELAAMIGEEDNFSQFLEANAEWIDWWYKNGDKGKQHYAIAYGEGKAKALFYVDFIIRMKNGHIYLFDTKSAGSDTLAHEKHNALLNYIQKNSTENEPLFGGIILQQGSNWLYSNCRLKIQLIL